MIFTSGLFFYHSNLIIKNLTTKEELKNVFNNVLGNPFKRSVCMNIKITLCPTLSQPSLIKKIINKMKRYRPEDPSKLVLI